MLHHLLQRRDNAAGPGADAGARTKASQSPAAGGAHDRPRRPRFFRAHPRLTAAVVVVTLLAGAVGCLYAYALRQWQMAQDALSNDRITEAQGPVGVCLAVWPYSARVHILAARVARYQGDFSGAESQLEQAQRADPGAKADVQLEYLLLRVQEGEEDAVTPDLMAYVAQKHPETGLIFRTLARAYMVKFSYGPALNVLDRWIEVDPGAARAYQWRGWVWERLDQRASAEKDYRRALELDAGIVDAHLRLADMALDKNDPPEALKHVEPLSRQFPGRADIKALLGRCRLMQGRTGEARPLLEGAVKDLPDDPPLLIALANLDLQDDRPAQAERWVRHALALDGTDSQARYTLSRILQAENRPGEAAAELARSEKDQAMQRKIFDLMRETASRPTTDPAAYSEIGNYLIQNGQERAGEYYLQQALGLDPNHRPALQALAAYYESKGNKDEAEAYRRRLAGGRMDAPR